MLAIPAEQDRSSLKANEWGGGNSLSILQVHYLSQRWSTWRRQYEEACAARAPAGSPGFTNSCWNGPKTLHLQITDLQCLSPELLSLPRPLLGPCLTRHCGHTIFSHVLISQLTIYKIFQFSHAFWDENYVLCLYISFIFFHSAYIQSLKVVSCLQVYSLHCNKQNLLKLKEKWLEME